MDHVGGRGDRGPRDPADDPRNGVDERWLERDMPFVLRSWYEYLVTVRDGVLNDLQCSYPGDDMPEVDEVERLKLLVKDWPGPETNRPTGGES